MMLQFLLSSDLSIALMGHFILNSLEVPGARIKNVFSNNVNQLTRKIAIITFTSYFILSTCCFLMLLFNNF